MKKLYILILTSLLSTFSLTAQNWSLVMPNDTLVYEKQDNNQFFTVWVDSIEVIGTDTTYFMNRISPGEVIGSGSEDDICISKEAVPGWTTPQVVHPSREQFCGLYVIINGVTSNIFFESRIIIIYEHDTVGSKWVCDSLNNDTMEIIDKKKVFLDIFQTSDSIKLFKFKDKTFALSKHHGLISGVDFTKNSNNSFELVGVQNLAVGEVIPMGKDFFNFKIGDIFYRRVGGADSDGSDYQTFKREITDTIINGDTVSYILNGGTDTATYWPNINPALNAYPNTLAICKPIFYDTNVWFYDYFFGLVFVFKDAKGIITKATSINDFNSNAYGYCNYDSVELKFPVAGPIAWYQVGLEPIREDFNLGLAYISDELTRYIIDGDTTVIIDGVRSISYQNTFLIYPNPTNTTINITTEKLNGISVLEMYDLQGRLITTKDFENKLTLDVSEWRSGVYFAIIKDTDGTVLHREKIIIQ